MSVFLQQLINGLALGSIYALMAVGYSLVYSILNFSNFAHGGVIMLGAYFGFYAMTLLSMPFLVGLIIASLACGLVAAALERIAYSPLRRRNAPSLYFIISAMGASIFFENLVIATIGATFKTYPQIFKETALTFGGISVNKIDLIMFIVAVISLICLVIILGKTKIGLAIRAASYSSRGATLMGVNVDMVIFVIFMIGGALAGIAGMMFGMRYTVYPTIGIITNKSFIAAVFGGLGSLPGAVIGSILLGLIETFAASAVSNYRDLIAFALLIFVLVIKPSGLMGKITEDKA